ncbi:50S ribosomal protein L7/L12 [Candidatus Gracilibacteria bacterium]|nr:50S ribosomal protein L7/L12 [Candidatus Gracilibacteria bacterium]MCF7896807.1 50S ribosomal protein L7/L12 [Candidatus Gracilibacteria bacterium]
MSDDATPATPAEETKDAAAPAEEAKKEEVPAKAAKEEKTEQTVELSKDAQKILDAVSDLKVLDLANLVKAMEEKFGVSAAAPVAAAAAPAAGGAAAEEKSSFSVELTAAGDNKIGAIKAVKAITGEGLGEAKATVEAAPKILKENVPKADAEQMKKDLEAAGCTVTLK